MSSIDFLIGVDGGGSGTRARLAAADGRELAVGTAGPSALALGVDAAWTAIDRAVDDAFGAAGRARPHESRLALGIGIAGANVPEWLATFKQRAPAFGALVVDTDAWTTLLGAHGGAPGAIVAVGTGIIGMAWYADGTRQTVGGWGFPGGDEGSGAWIGLRAVAHLERVLDGSETGGALAETLAAICGHDRDALTAWLATATQTRYASLARSVIACGTRDTVAQALLREAGGHVAALAQAVDSARALPLALCGGLAEPLRPWWPGELAARARAPLGDAASGALRMIGMR